MSSFWATDDGWPYEDSPAEADYLDPGVDDEWLSLATSPHLLDGLDEMERKVLGARFGLEGQPVLSMKQLQLATGLERESLRNALGSGLSKIRTNLGLTGPAGSS